MKSTNKFLLIQVHSGKPLQYFYLSNCLVSKSMESNFAQGGGV
jgi:hypothetical protein